METITINTYSITELTGTAQQRAKDLMHELLEDSFLDVIQDEINNYYIPDFIHNKGFDAERVYYALSYSQGDGAMFEGRVNDITKFTTNKRAIKVINEYHEKSYDFTLDFPELKPTQYRLKEEFDKIEQNIIDIYEETCKEIYKQLRDHHNAITNEDSIIDFAEGNGYQFDERGRII
jgi:chromosome segregation ATPase